MIHTKKCTLGLIYGGQSVEHDISVLSARNIKKHIDSNRFDVLLIGISKKGIWHLVSDIEKTIDQGEKLRLDLNASKPCFTTDSSQPFCIDVAFPIVHGNQGEDGSLQGLLKVMQIPTTGSDTLGSALCMSKIVTKKLLIAAGLPVSRYLYFSYHERDRITFKHVTDYLGLPLMVKATNLGSSIGVSKVNSKQAFLKALEDSFCYDESILLEEYIEGRELECAVLGTHNPEASVPGEIVLSKNHEFYDFDAKYVDSTAVTIKLPANFNSSIVERIKKLSIQAFQALHCCDMARVDMFLDKKNNLYINEINTLPGFTNTSMFPSMWKEQGVSYRDLITRIIDLSMARHQAFKRTKQDFLSPL